jgi:methylthioribulose-1-phosphate dehydratase
VTDGAGPAGQLAEIGPMLAAEAARFASLGWMRGSSGNLSAVLSTDPLRLAVTASGLDKGTLSAADITVVDSAGRLVPGDPGSPRAAPSAEAALHARAARLTGARAVVHVHTIAAVVAGRRWPAGVELADLEMLKGIGLPAVGERVLLPVIANSQDMTELGDRLERAWNPRVPGVLVADHGLYAWGASLLNARHHTEIIEWLVEFMTAAEPR